MSILLPQYSEPVLVLFLGYRIQSALGAIFIAEFYKCFMYWREIYVAFFLIKYVIWTFLLFIQWEKATLKKCESAKRLICRHEIWACPDIIRPIFFWPIGDRINGVPL